MTMNHSSFSAVPRRARPGLRLGLWVGCVLAFAAAGSCVPVGSGDPNDPSDTSRPASTGYIAVVFINHSSQLVQDVISVERRNVQPEVWVTPVTPDSWDALLVDYPFQRITIIGVTPVDLQTGEAGDQIPYKDGTYADRDRVTCGSVIVVRTRDEAGGAGGIVVEVATIPDPDGGDFILANRSARSPGADSALVLIRPEVPDGVSAQARFTWENGDGQVFASNWAISGVGVGTAALVECPVKRVGWGNLRDPGLAGASIDSPAADITAPPALRAATSSPGSGQAGDFACGDVINLQLVRDGAQETGFRLDAHASSDDSGVPAGGIDLFGNIRRLLDSEGMAGRLSNTALLLPEPPEGAR